MADHRVVEIAFSSRASASLPIDGPPVWEGCLTHSHLTTCDVAEGFSLIAADYHVAKSFSFAEDRPACVVLGVCLTQATTHDIEKAELDDGVKEDAYVYLYGAGQRTTGHIAHDADARNRFVSLTLSWALFQQITGDLGCEGDLAGFAAAANRAPVLRRRAVSEPIRSAAEQILKVEHPGVIEDIFLRGKALEMLSLCLEAFARPHVAMSPCIRPADAKRILQARDLLASDLTREWSLNQLAREVGLNVKKLKVGFRDILGETVFGYLRELRMAHAEELIRRDGYNIDQVAYAVGYSSASHFSQVFRRRFGIVPSAYRSKFKFAQGADALASAADSGVRAA